MREIEKLESYHLILLNEVDIRYLKNLLKRLQKAQSLVELKPELEPRYKTVINFLLKILDFRISPEKYMIPLYQEVLDFVYRIQHKYPNLRYEDTLSRKEKDEIKKELETLTERSCEMGRHWPTEHSLSYLYQLITTSKPSFEEC